MEAESTILSKPHPKNKFVLVLTMFATVILVPIALIIGIIIGLGFSCMITWEWLSECLNDIKFGWNNATWFGK